jgi:predicted DNA-binding protein (UPF0251 family)
MVRPFKKRYVEKEPSYTCFKPAQVPKNLLEKVELKADELEALRYINLESLSQEQASKKM